MTLGSSRRGALAAMAGGLAWAGGLVRAQAPKRARVGWISSGSSSQLETLLEVQQAFRALGYPQGEPGVIMLFTEGKRERLDGIAAELVAMKPDVIFAGATAGTLAAQRATATIPILFVGASDPVGAGFVDSLARPGRNITGVSNFALDTASKPLELLRSVIPKARRFGVLGSDNRGMDGVIEATRKASRELGMELHVERAETLPAIESAFAAFRRARAEGLVVISDTPTIVNRVRVAELAARARLPAIYSYAVQVEAGGLMSYGPDPASAIPQIVGYMDRILKGAKPGDLAVQGPLAFELALNMDAARELGLEFPPEIVVRANRIVGRKH
jgi:putative ABC transport system substrate-binding protein